MDLKKIKQLTTSIEQLRSLEFKASKDYGDNWKVSLNHSVTLDKHRAEVLALQIQNTIVPLIHRAEMALRAELCQCAYPLEETKP